MLKFISILQTHTSMTEAVGQYTPKYPPYVNDLNIPGKYLISFSILGIGFKDNDDEIFLELDVAGSIYKYLPLYNADGSLQINNEDKVEVKKYTEFFRTFGSKRISKKELSNNKWNTFTIEFYSSGYTADLIEYRACPFNNYQLKEYEEVYFDFVKIERIV